MSAISIPTTAVSIPRTGWRAALTWGIGAALLHRVLLSLWLALVWSMVSPALGDAQVDFHTASAEIPALTTPAEQTMFGVWRRWDAVHYLDLATNGYRVENAGATVFGLLTPLGFALFDAVLPGSLDLAAMVFETVAFAIALAFLYRLCEVYYGDPALGSWAVAVMALQPLSYFFAAPMSESIYLAMVLGAVCFAAKDRWLWAGVLGFLAVLARNQGVLLLPVLLLVWSERHWHDYPSWSSRLRGLIAQVWPLALIPAGFVGFEVYRRLVGLPSLSETYSIYSYNYFTNPVDGLITNLRWFLDKPVDAFQSLDLLALLVTLIASVVLVRFKKHRRVPLLFYTWSFVLLFVSRINYFWGTNEVMFTQSFARYSLALFPLTVLAADMLRHAGFWGRILMVLTLLAGLALFSGLYVFALTGP